MLEINKVYCGDCFELIKLLEDKSVDVSFTSPPYNSVRHKKYDNYTDDIDDYFLFLKNIIDEMIRVTKKYVIINIQANYYNKKDVYKLIGNYSDSIERILIWNKTNPTPSQSNYLTNSHEYFICITKQPLIINSVSMKDVITDSINNETSKVHKAIMKKELSDLFIKEFTKKNDVVLDVFMGTGTTALSCKENGRNYIGFEIDEKYFKMCIDRINGISFDGQTSIFTDFDNL